MINTNLRTGNISQLSLINRIKLQLFKEIENRAEEKVHNTRFLKWIKTSNDFALEDDKNLTNDQIKQIKQFWERYKFAYPVINYDEFKAYMNRNGVFDPKFVPDGIRTMYIAPYLQHKHYYWSEQNKTLLNKIFHNIKQPQCLIRRMNGYFYDGEYNRINLIKAVQICLEHLEYGKELILKPNDISGGGRGIRFITEATEEYLKNIFMSDANSFVVQDVMEQHVSMKKLNPYSVNTLRITSIIWKNKVVILAAALRIGTSEKRVDNWNAGGIIVGVNKNNGSVYPFGLDKRCKQYSMTIGSVDLTNGYFIPSWEKVLKTVEKAHNNIPYIKLASWDIAIDENGEPTLIEVNFAGDWHIHQLTTGAILGNLTQEILDKAILDNYYKKHSTLNFDFREYYNHIEVEKYVGRNHKVKVPQEMYGKPVTVIGKRAFRMNKNIEEIVLPHTVKFIGERAFSGCNKLRKINISNKMKIHKTAFGD